MAATENSNPKKSLTRRFFKSAWLALKPIGAWGFTVACFYIAVGSVIYRAWWHRALFDGDLFRWKFLKFALGVLVVSPKEAHPIGVTVCAVAVGLGVFALIRYGRLGLKKALMTFPLPSKPLAGFATLLLAAAVYGAYRTEATFLTPDELAKKWDELRIEFEKTRKKGIWDYTDPLGDGPLSGFYLYLDDRRVSKAYHASLENLVIASKRTMSKSDDSIGAEVNAGQIKVNAQRSKGQELETVKSPPPSTPERQVQTLLQQMKSETGLLRMTEHGSSLDHFVSPTFLEIQTKEAGVALTPEQVEKLKVWRLTRTRKFLEQSRSALFTCTGSLKFHQPERGTYRIDFKSGGYGDVICSGTLDEQFLDPVLVSDLKKATNTITVHGNLLGIVVSSVSDENQIRIQMLPCAIW